ncbi:DUF4236 domain-containing protein [Tardiphaga sp.]|uniref:DUF4236 domain-containing protein n=1 Tax=Tardiphaga sp. TaxID=1926292 RepID=UPI00352A20B4
MGLRFRKSIKLVPGVRLNIGLRRTSLSFGGKGFTYNLGSNGSRVTVGLPGSGLSYSTNLQHQHPATLLANSLPARKRYSATPFVVIAFILGLIYIAFQSTSPGGKPTPVNASAVPALPADITGTISQRASDESHAIEGPVPLPRPRTRPRESVGPPLQLIPQQ